MKKFFIIVVILFVYTCNLEAQTYISMRPNWTFNPPQAENSTYEYYVSRGVGNTEKEARKDAFILAFKEAQTRVGVGANSAEIFKTFQNSDMDFNVIASKYEIPMKEVCYFSEKSRDGQSYYYYLLLQLAISGNITPDFRPFSGDCYDFSKAKELREILKLEYKEKIEEDKKRQEQEDKLKKQEERKNKRLDNSYCADGKHRYIAWNIAGTGYPWKLVSGIEFRYGGVIGGGAWLDLGMDFSPTYDGRLHQDLWGVNTQISFHYSGGLKFYFYKGLFVDAGYSALANDTSGGLLFHAGYNLVTNLDKYGFFLGLSAGAAYEMTNKAVAPSINLKIGVAWNANKQ